jgi:RNA polymerase sigma-70 factor (ECF subfamily)
MGEGRVDIEAWYGRYGESVYRRCLRLSRDHHQALDLTQEVFLRAHQYRASYRGEASPLTWLFTLADRCFFDMLRKPGPISSAELREFLIGEHDAHEGTFVSHDLITRLLDRSPPDVRSIVLHRYFDELDLESIAQRLGVHERTVRRKLAKFLARAEKMLRGTA